MRVTFHGSILVAMCAVLPLLDNFYSLISGRSAHGWLFAYLAREAFFSLSIGYRRTTHMCDQPLLGESTLKLLHYIPP